MFRTRNALIDSFQEGDVLFPFRRRIWTLFGTVCVCIFLPGSIFVLANGYTTLAIGTIFLLGTFVLNAYCVLQKKASGLAMLLFVVTLTFVIGLCLMQRGVVGVFWTFPGMLMINFLTVGRIARVYTAGFFVYVSGIMLYTLEPIVSIRGIVGLGLAILITNIFLEMIEKLQTKLVEQSSIDPLTGAFNRREMDSVLRNALERKRRSHTPASLLVLDVDEFKNVNDTYGHAAGDRVLKDLTTLIRGRMRHMDQLFRLGGEEFLVLLPDTPLAGATIFAEELRRIVSGAELVDDRAITISIGISELCEGESADEWLKRGDDAVYQAKNGGRNRIVGGDLDIFIPTHRFEPVLHADLGVEVLLGG